MARTLEDSRRWTADGSALLRATVAGLTDAEVRTASCLPEWTVGQLVAHIAANADALGNLVHWAATGIETPMYPSVEARQAAIEQARTKDAGELLEWLDQAGSQLEAGFDALSEAQWTATVKTIQGRAMPATEIPWLRSREVLIHTVDLDRGIGFADLPADFVEALIDDICTKRELEPSALPAGPRHQIAAWLAGRPHSLPEAPRLGPWL